MSNTALSVSRQIFVSHSPFQRRQLIALQSSLSTTFKLVLPTAPVIRNQNQWQENIANFSTKTISFNHRAIVLSKEYLANHHCVAELTTLLAQRMDILPILFIHGFGSFDEARHSKKAYHNHTVRSELKYAILHQWKIIYPIVGQSNYHDVTENYLESILYRLESEAPPLTLPDTADLSNALVAKTYKKLAKKVTDLTTHQVLDTPSPL